MKRYLIILAVALLVITGCASVDNSIVPNVESSIDGDNVAEVVAMPSYGSAYFEKGTLGYNLIVKNTSDSIIKVNWEKSSINYGSVSSLLFITGQKYIDANNPMPASTIPVNGSLTKEVYSSNQVFYGGTTVGWMMMPIKSYDSTLVICIEHDGKDTYYTFNFSPLSAN